MKSIALKVGGFPSIQKLESFFYLIKKNKEVINFDPKSLIGGALDLAESALPDQVMGMDPRAIFNFFSKKAKGKIGMDDFGDIIKYMGLNLSKAQ
jgi:hypothetical protein